MTGEPYLTVIGNIAGEPELRFAPSGVAVATFTVASTPRSYNKDSGQYEDGVTLWMRCTAFRGLAENIVESCPKGTRVIVSGSLKQEEWTNKEGERRSGFKLMVDDIGPSLKWASASVAKAERRSAASSRPSAPSDDPWSQPASVGAGADDSEIPF